MQHRAQCILWFAEFKSILTYIFQHILHVHVQCNFCKTHHSAPDHKAIYRWYNQFQNIGGVTNQRLPGRPRTSDENVEHICLSCVWKPKHCASEFGFTIFKMTIQNVL